MGFAVAVPLAEASPVALTLVLRQSGKPPVGVVVGAGSVAFLLVSFGVLSGAPSTLAPVAVGVLARADGR